MKEERESGLAHLKTGLDAIPPVERSIEDDVLRETRAFRGVSLEQATHYLEELGGERTDKTDIEGEGWNAHLSARKVPVGPSYQLTEVTVTWIGKESVLEPIIFRFRLKTFRAPG